LSQSSHPLQKIDINTDNTHIDNTNTDNTNIDNTNIDMSFNLASTFPLYSETGMLMRKFNICVKPDQVDRVIVCDGLRVISTGVMPEIDTIVGNANAVFYNCTVPDSRDHALYLLGGEGITDYTFNDLFSMPLSVKALKDSVTTPPEIKKWINTVVINTAAQDAQPTKKVLLDIPKSWQEFFKIEPTIVLEKVQRDKIKFDAEPNPSNFFKIGIDPNADNWSAKIALTLPDKFIIDNMVSNSLDKLFEEKISVAVYISELAYTINCTGEELNMLPI
jgi:hypothetical protein